MKKLNLIKRLWTDDSHEKQSPQRFARCAAMLIMLLTLGVGQMWGLDLYLDISACTGWTSDGATIKLYPGTGSDVTGTSIATNLYKFTVSSATGTMWFKRMNGSSTWNQGSVTYNSSSNLYKLTGWNAVACSGANINNVTKNNYIYFVNNIGWENANKYFVIGHDQPTAYSKVYSMSPIEHTQLLYVANTADNWTDATYYGFCATDNSWGNGDWGSSNLSNASKYTGTIKTKKDLASSKYYLFDTNGNASDGASLIMSDAQTSYSANKFNTKLYAYRKVLATGETNFASSSSNSVGTVTISGYAWSGRNSTSSTSANIGDNTSANITTAITSEITLTAVPGAGYTFAGWYTSAPTTLAASTPVSTDLTYTYNIGINSGYNIHAGFIQETSHDVTIQEYCTSTSTEISSSTRAIGELTYATVTAPEIYGYTFDYWTKGTGIDLKAGDELTSSTIHVKTKASGAYVLTARYTEDLSSPWVLKGGTNITGDNWATEHAMTKKTGHSTENVAYYTANISSTNSGTSGTADAWSFKLIKNSTWYGLTAEGSYWWKRSTSANQSLTTSGANIQICADVAGTYEIKVDYSTATPKITVTFPTKYTVTYSVAPSGAANAITTSPSVTSGGTVAAGTSMTFTHATAKTGYSWYRWENGSGSSLGTGSTYTTTINANTTVVAKYTENTYNVTATASAGGSATPASATAMGQITGGDITASPNTGYNFTNWTITSGSGYFGASGTNTTSTTANTKFRPTAAATILANFTPKTTTITLNNYDATTPGTTSVTATYDAAMPAITLPEKTGYTFGGYWGAPGGSGPKYYNADGSSAQNWNNEIATYTLHAHWIAKTTTITLDQTGAASAGSVTTRTGTYNADMPDITGSGSLPTAPQGYAFMGYYDALEPLGTKYYNADGTSAHTWDKEDAAFTLHAYFKQAEITGITFSPGTVVENNSTVNVTAVISPEPTGTTTVCWRILYDNGSALDPQPAFTPASRQGTTVSFTAPNASGMYKAEAVLHLGSGCGGSDISTYEADFQVAGSHNVTVAYKQGSTTIKASTIITGRPLDWSEPITAPEIFGYTFDHWTAGDGITLSADGSTPVGSDESSANPIYITAIYNGTLTANYTQKNIVYFKDNLEWTDPNDADAHIYVNLLTEDYWNASNGSGNKGKSNCNLAMDRVPGTADIFYYDYGSKPTSHFISFTKESMSNYESFYQGSAAHVVFPSRALDALSTDNANGLGFYAATPMFVPLATQTPVDMNSGHAKYYNDGYWTKFTPGTGYTLEIYNNSTGAFIKSEEFTSADDLMPMKATVDLEGGQKYKFQLKRDGDVFYGNSGTMTYTDHGQNTAWDFYNNSPFKMCTIVTNAAGEYTFNLSYSPNKGGNSNRLRIAVDYPVASGDYRLVYTDNTRSGRIKPSAIVAKENDGTATVSFFVRKDQSPVLRIQQATVALDGTITWKEYPTDGTPTNQITGSIASAITATGVWNFNLEMNGSGAMSVASAEAYTGNYYIRTDAANSKWDNYRTDPDHLMTYSDYLKSDVHYTHYYTHWVDKNTEGRKNVKFVIANDYSPCISDTLIRETASGTWANIASFITTGGDLIRSANVRFMWDEETNNIARAYIDGAQGTGSDIFLRMLSNDGKIKQGETVKTSVAFQDNGNWIYEANVLAQPEAQIKLKSTWGSGTTIEQYFKGSASETESLVGGSGNDWYPIRVLYDFKTNRLVAAYLPTTGTITSDIEINADVMFIREHHGDIAQLTFSGSGAAISDIKTAYGVLRLNKWTINNKSKSAGHAPLSPELSRFERDMFYISFPFRVNLEEVFGFGTYGTHWIIEEYDGAGRAQNGFWKDSPSYWKFITNRKGKFLEPNTGYIVALDLDELGESSSVWANTDQVELYFPSYGNLSTITSSSVTHEIPAHTCTINRPTPQGDRRIKDSHWNVISVPTYINTSNVTFANTDWTTTGDGKLGPNFLYTWNKNDNTLTATSGKGYTYKAMHAYIVQYYGDITWTTSVTPQLAPRRNQEAPKDVEFRIELQQNESLIDQTFVRLSNEEEVSNEFAFGEDMSKEYHKNKANIYTLIGAEQVAGNCLPMTDQTTIVPMGIITTKAGEYTISIPNGTNGIGVTLVDSETGIRSNLALEDYTIALDEATYEDRFYLEISPIKHVATGIEEITGDGSQVTGARKVMVDGILYIIKDGKVFSTQGARVK